MYVNLFFVVAIGLYLTPITIAQDSTAGPQRAQCAFPDGKDVTVVYFSPRMNGRKIFGGFVPYGQVWETGDGKPTMFATNTNLMVGGKRVPAGKYTIFTIPDMNKWTLIIKRGTGNPDLPYSYESSELVRVDLLVRRMTPDLESFTITFDQRRGGCVLNLRWEAVEASALIAETK